MAIHGINQAAMIRCHDTADMECYPQFSNMLEFVVSS